MFADKDGKDWTFVCLPCCSFEHLGCDGLLRFGIFVTRMLISTQSSNLILSDRLWWYVHILLVQGIAVALKCGATKAMFDSTVRLHSLLFIFRSELTAECYNSFYIHAMCYCLFVSCLLLRSLTGLLPPPFYLEFGPVKNWDMMQNMSLVQVAQVFPFSFCKLLVLCMFEDKKMHPLPFPFELCQSSFFTGI